MLTFAQLVFTGFCVVVLLIETVGGAHHIQQLSFPQLERLFSVSNASNRQSHQLISRRWSSHFSAYTYSPWSS